MARTVRKARRWDDNRGRLVSTMIDDRVARGWVCKGFGAELLRSRRTWEAEALAASLAEALDA
jgi:hypothetical protein